MNKVEDIDKYNFKNKYEEYTKIHQQNIVDDIIIKYDFFFLGSSADYPYLYENGVFKEDCGGLKLKEIIQSYIHRDLATSRRVNEVYNLLAMQRQQHRAANEINNYDKHIINFKNCMYNAKTGEVLEHNTKYLSTCQIPHNLDFNNYKLPRNFLRFVYSNCSKEKKQLLFEYIGYCMTRDLFFKKALYIKGVKDSGKTVLTDLITNIIGRDNVSNVPLQKLSEQYSTIQIKDKLLNLCSDIQSTALKDTGTFKQIIGGDAILCEAKYKEQISIIPFCKQVYTSNYLIDIIGDRSDATTDKFLYLTWDYVPDKKDCNLLKTLIEEIPDIIVLCMKALKEAYTIGKLTETEESKEINKEVKGMSDNLQAFINNCCYVGKNEKIRTSYFYKKYTEYCELERLKPRQKTTISKDMDAKSFYKKKLDGIRYYCGLCLDEERWKDLTEEAYKEITNTQQIIYKQGNIIKLQ